jgi:hypothetical protein
MTDQSELETLREEYEKQLFDLRQLLEVSKSLNSLLDYHILIDAILFNVMAQMKVLKAGIFAKKDLDSTRFSLHRNYKGFEIEHGVNYSIAEDHPIIKLFSQAIRMLFARGPAGSGSGPSRASSASPRSGPASSCPAQG